MNEILTIDFDVKTGKLEKDLKKWETFFEQAKKRMEEPFYIEWKANQAKLDVEIKKMTKLLKLAEKNWDFDAQVRITADISKAREILTMMKAETRNFAKTGDPEKSVLWTLFENIWRKIESTTVELMKMGRSTKEIEFLRTRVNELQNSMNSWKISASSYAKSIGDIEKELTKISNWWAGFIWTIKNISSGMLGFIGGWAIAYGLVWIWKWILSLWDKLEQSSLSFEVMLWSADKAKILLTDLSNFSAKTPFEIQWIRANAKQLIAMGIGVKDILPTLKALWDVSAGLSVPLERLTLAYGQVIAKWKLQWWELKQFTEAGVPLIETISKTLWVSTSKFYDLVEAGEISSAQVVQAFKDMTWEGGKFANMMEIQSHTLTGMWSNLKDQISIAWEKIWTSLLPIAKNVVSSLGSLVSFFTSVWWQALSFAVAIWVVSLWIWSMVPALLWLSTAFITASASGTILAWVLSFIGWPITLVIAGISAIAWWLYYYNNQADESTKKTESLKNELSNLQKQQEENKKAFDKWSISQEEFTKRTNDNAKAQSEHRDAIDKSTLWMIDYQRKMNELAALHLKPDTEKYVTEKKAIIDLIKAEIALLQVRKQSAGAMMAEKELLRATQNQNNMQVGWDTWVGTINMVWSAYSDLADKMREVSQVDIEINQKQKEIENFDKTIKEMTKTLDDANTKTVWGWSNWWSSKGSWKSARDKQLEAEKKRLEEVKKKEEELGKARTTAYEKAIKSSDAFKSAVDEANKKLDEQKRKMDEIKAKATETLLDIEEKMSWEKTGLQDKLAQRYIKIFDELRSSLGWADGVFAWATNSELESALFGWQIAWTSFDWFKKELELIKSTLSSDELSLAVTKEKRSETEKITAEYQKQFDLNQREKDVADAKLNNRFLTNAKTGEIQFFDKNGEVIQWGNRSQVKDFASQAKEIQDIADESIKIEQEKMTKISAIVKDYEDERARLRNNYYTEDKNLKIAQENMAQAFFKEELARMTTMKNEAINLTNALISLKNAGGSAQNITNVNTTNNNQQSTQVVQVKTVTDIQQVNKTLGIGITLKK